MIRNILKNKKVKATNQRVRILEYIYKKKKLTIKDLIFKFEDIDQSTIYRILAIFENKNIIIKVIIENKIYYKINNDDHKHFIECINCHQKLELKECPYNNINLHGFIINKEENIKGICKNCQNNKIGIFVGSFNPPTKAHYEIGKKLVNEEIINKIIYIPCDNKKKKNLININHRFNMLKEMIKNDSLMDVDRFKVEDKDKSFNYNDLKRLKDKYLGDLYIIIGSDNLCDLINWNNYKEMLNNYYFIVINRDNNNDLDVIVKDYKEYKHKFILINYHNNISSTHVRNILNENGNIDDFLCKKVFDYIKNNNLY